MKVWVVVPAYNEAHAVGDVVKSLIATGYSNVIVVDDGSTDNTSERAGDAGARIVRHGINRGAGAATVTGMHAALLNGADIVVTFDADGQHNSADISKLIEPIQRHTAEVVLGARKFSTGMPLLRRAGNFIGNVVTGIVSGIWVRDSQSGLRAYSRHAIEVMDLHSNGYEFCSEVIREIHNRTLTYVQVPVSVHYSKYSMSKGQSFDAGVSTIVKLFVRSIMR